MIRDRAKGEERNSIEEDRWKEKNEKKSAWKAPRQRKWGREGAEGRAGNAGCSAKFSFKYA